MENKIELNNIVYHRDVYSHNEPLRVVGIRFDQLELEGDYSGGTNGVKQKSWMPIVGVSRVRSHMFKEECRTLALNMLKNEDGYYNNTDVELLIKNIKKLTEDIVLNPEIK